MKASRHLRAMLAAIFATALLCAQVLAQPSDQNTATAQNPTNNASQSQSQPQEIEEVVARGRRLSEYEFDIPNYVREFIGEVVALPPGGGFARWHRRVCVGVHNLEPSAAQYIVDRISLLALEVGLEPGEPGCRPEIIIIFTVDAKELATYMVENEDDMLRPGGGTCCMQLGLAALDEFANSDRPVRWWAVSMPVGALNGQRAIHVAKDGRGNYPVTSVAGPSRIHSGIRHEMQTVIVIVDGTQLGGKTWEQIGDYLAVVSLAQIDPNADPSDFDSILNLFTNPAAFSGLTDWDRSYMQALYSVNLERDINLQRNTIVNYIAENERNFSE